LVEFTRTVVTAWPSGASARRYVHRLDRGQRRFRGDFDIPKKETGPRTYRPGERGAGDLQRVSLLGWRGTGLRRIFHYVFYTSSSSGLVVGPPSGVVLGGRFVLRRGRYVADVEWLARNQATDRRLSHLPRRLLRRLG
jgi:hypothetical protein